MNSKDAKSNTQMVQTCEIKNINSLIRRFEILIVIDLYKNRNKSIKNR